MPKNDSTARRSRRRASVNGSATPFLDAIREIKSAQDDAKYRLEKLLMDRGWTYTSDTPGCRWMWVKKLTDGRTALVTLETATDFEIKVCGEPY